MIDTMRLIACGMNPTQAKAFAPAIAATCDRFGITSVMQQAAFVAQCMHESQGFTHLEENLYYSTPERIKQAWPSRFMNIAEAAPYAKNPQRLANKVYSGRMGNGDEASGDGWKYRGRGPIQITGRATYAALTAELSGDFIACPELLIQPEAATLSAGWYWVTRGCNACIQNGDFETTTLKINGGMNGARERRALYATCLESLR